MLFEQIYYAMKRNNRISMRQDTLIKKLAELIDKREKGSHRKPEVYGWDDGKIYFSDGEKENCINDHPELLDTITKICQEYFVLKKQKFIQAKHLVEKQRAKKRR